MCERLTRREFLALLGGGAAAVISTALLGKKYVGEAKALGRAAGVSPLSVRAGELPQVYKLGSEQQKIPPEGQKSIESPPAVQPVEKREAVSPVQPLKNRSRAEVGEIDTGRKLLECLNLLGKVVYIVYGRPPGGWGSLGLKATAEQCWELVDERKKDICEQIGKSEEDVAYTVLNPVYFVDNQGKVPLKDVFMLKALELASQNKGIVAPDFSDLENAKRVFLGFEEEKKIPQTLLPYLGVSIDVEHFAGHSLEAQKINDFAKWFAEKHKAWADQAGVTVPGLIFVYTFSGGRVLNMSELQQYYLLEETLLVIVFDGYGKDTAKLAQMASYVRSLENTSDFPALVGVMEFQSRHSDKYDTVPIGSTFKTLEGAPVFFLASQ